MASWTTEKEQLVNLAHTFDKSIKLYTKDNFLMKSIGWILQIITFGKFKKETFQYHYAITLGNFQFYPENWDFNSVSKTLVHESAHTKQFRKFSLGLHPLLGMPVAAFVYLLFPLPVLCAYGRFWMECNACVSFWKYAIRNLGWTGVDVHLDAKKKALNISSAAYFWALPQKTAISKYRVAAKKVINDFYKEKSYV